MLRISAGEQGSLAESNVMPHIFVEFSANVKEHIDTAELVRNVHDAAASHQSVPMAGLRTRVVEREQYLIANGDDRNMFVAVLARLNGSRGKESLLEVRDLLVQACKTTLADVQRHQPIAISVEVQPIDPEMRINENSIRDYFEELA